MNTPNPNIYKTMHKIRVHPIESGRPVLAKVKLEKTFATAQEAKWYIDKFNETAFKEAGKEIVRAVYVGKFDPKTGHLL